ncbi:hypothetical protein OF385_12420 [Glutamicibacter sp. JL.03c]|uniref:hypothetical protein n=1 Tax=Glutamicibacter sp. JL.03c TaxID=2984842 RepID=UPI0021F784E1|nr:hypothetical protein [Glutamicibacter sp. JL.03c]UYQ76817.1 hypothetical protein OF385_12420 [Glutamicibacter sp. JL.03c]
MRSSARTGLIISSLAAKLLVACLVAGPSGHDRAMVNLPAHVKRELSPTEVEIRFWTGFSAVAKISWPDGSSDEPGTISLEDGYRPVINEARRNDQLPVNPDTSSERRYEILINRAFTAVSLWEDNNNDGKWCASWRSVPAASGMGSEGLVRGLYFFPR